MTPGIGSSSLLSAYDAAFDTYMDQGRLPDPMPPDEVLNTFMQQVLLDNPQLRGNDPVWAELLKQELLKFIEAMLELFVPYELAYKKEKALLVNFAEADIQEKRRLWKTVCSTINGRYSPEEVNIEGYVQQFDEEHNEAIFRAIVDDWGRTCDKHLMQAKQRIVNQKRDEMERHLTGCGQEDYRRHKEVEALFYSYPQLSEIMRIIGREQPQSDDEMDDTVRHYLPLLASPPQPAAEVEEIAVGNDLQHLLPSETALLADPATEPLFYLKYATRQLQLFANRSKQQNRHKTEQRHLKTPRLQSGPVIVAIDTSGSMSGQPEQIAHSLLHQLLKLARAQHRKCFLISFSVQAQFIDLSLTHNWLRLDQFLLDGFTGGTNGEAMLTAALQALRSNTYAMADVLIISDFLFPRPVPSTLEAIRHEHTLGTRFYGLQIGCCHDNYNSILDRIWRV